MHFIILKHSWHFYIVLWDSSHKYLLWQILIFFINSWSLWMDLHVKLEPPAHSAMFGSISLLRLKVFSFPSTFCSFLWILAVFRGWLSRFHSTVSLSGKKPLRVQMSLTGEAPNSPSQMGYNVMLGETTRCPEIEKRLFSIFLLHSTWTF